MFRPVHPQKSTKFRGRDIPQKVSGLGANNIPDTQQESRFVRCQWCSAINDIIKRSRGDGWSGNIEFVAISGTNLKQPVVGGAGCWHCGASNYY